MQWWLNNVLVVKQHSGGSAGDESRKHWLNNVVVVPPALLDPPPVAARLRPLIYVYDLPPDYNVRMLEYRVEKHTCANRVCDPVHRSRTIVSQFTSASTNTF